MKMLEKWNAHAITLTEDFSIKNNIMAQLSLYISITLVQETHWISLNITLKNMLTLKEH